jgi:hypothetical protein
MILRISGLSAGELKLLASACGSQVDPREEHHELCRQELNAILRNRMGHLVAPYLETLLPDGRTVAIEAEDLDPLPATIEEDEEMTGQGVLSDAVERALRGRRSSCARRWTACRERS